MEAKLIEVTGKTWDELFPESLRCNTEFLYCPKETEETRRISGEAIAAYSEKTRARLMGGGEKDELVRQRISESIRVLNEREKLVVNLRFGLNGNDPHSLDEVKTKLKVSRERVRQIEAKALRKLQFNPISKRILGSSTEEAFRDEE